jgi:subtilisin family serine protease
MHRIARPRPGSLEYRLSWGVGSIDAQRAYARGITGAGVTIAFIDTGVEASRPGLGRLSPLSVDLIEPRSAKGVDAHGEQVASLAAAPLDGAGTVGVAYRSTVLAIRADIDGSCAKQCAVRAGDLARGIDYALDHGARIIGVPLVGYHPLPAIEKALQRAVDSGAVIIAAAGNDGVERPAYPARYAADPRFAASILVAGATTPRGQMPSWSNRAGEAAARYVAAPGDRVVTDCDEKTCQLVSGTSYSTAYVAGALALLLESRPEMSPQQAAELVLQTARRGTRPDATAGCGEVDVGRALRVARDRPAAAG